MCVRHLTLCQLLRASASGSVRIPFPQQKWKLRSLKVAMSRPKMQNAEISPHWSRQGHSWLHCHEATILKAASSARDKLPRRPQGALTKSIRSKPTPQLTWIAYPLRVAPREEARAFRGRVLRDILLRQGRRQGIHGNSLRGPLPT